MLAIISCQNGLKMVELCMHMNAPTGFVWPCERALYYVLATCTVGTALCYGDGGGVFIIYCKLYWLSSSSHLRSQGQSGVIGVSYTFIGLYI